jgi:3-hydroxyacyl-CoA dehydrogenase/3a,7a,12a-trihydroxy-5b-cholest-24-enoyl-CoA hydratase
MWKESDTRVVFRCKVQERNAEVITRAAVELYREVPQPRPPQPKEAPKAAAPAAKAQAEEEQAEASGDVFVAIRAFVARSPDLAAKIKTVFQFRLANPASVWTINLKDAPGSVGPGETAKPDVTLELTDADFLAMTSGKADPQKLYFSGKLKISGNVMASQKLEFLRQIDRQAAKAAILEARKAGGTAAAAAAPAAAPRAPEAQAIFEGLSRRLAAEPAAARGIDAVIRFRLTAPDAEWTVDLKGGAARVAPGAAGEPTAVVTMSDEDLSALAHGTEPARRLFMTGRMRVDGDVRPVQKLEALLRTK